MPEIKRRADAERNLRRIIEAATALLAANPAASMAEIAAASGLVRATLYRHFPTRDDLLRAMYSAALDDALEAILSVEPERGKVTDAIARVVDAVLVVGDRYRILSEERRRYPELREQEESVGAPLIALVERGRRDGEIRDDLPLRWQVAALGSLINEALRAVGREDIGRAEAGSLVTRTFLESMRPRRR
ncbi:MAG: TetR/AcrR family transcriptional regulator [Solirubrobacterales bacterium]